MLYTEHFKGCEGNNIFRFEGELVGYFEAVLTLNNCRSNTVMTAFSFTDGTTDRPVLGLQVSSSPSFDESFRGYVRIIFQVSVPDMVCRRMLVRDQSVEFLPVQLAIVNIRKVEDFNEVTHHSLSVMMEHAKRKPQLPRKSLSIVGLDTTVRNADPVDEETGISWRELDYYMLEADVRRIRDAEPSVKETGEDDGGVKKRIKTAAPGSLVE